MICYEQVHHFIYIKFTVFFYYCLRSRVCAISSRRKECGIISISGSAAFVLVIVALMHYDYLNKLPQQGRDQILKADVLADDVHKLLGVDRSLLLRLRNLLLEH